jgi:hypothetical protein
MSHRVKKVQYLNGYCLDLLFDNGKRKVVDLSEIMNKAQNMLLPLKDLEYFRKVKCDGFSIVWPNGMDLCPDVLYKMGKDIPKEKKKSMKRPKNRIPRKKRKLSPTLESQK